MKVSSFSNVFFSFKGKVGQAYFNYFGLPLLFMVIVYGLPIALAVMMPQLMIGSLENESSSMIETVLPIIIFVVSILVIVAGFYLVAYMKKRNTEYVLNNSYYGQGAFETKLETKAFMFINLKVIGLTFLMMLGFLLLALAMGVSFEQLASLQPENIQEEGFPVGIMSIFVGLYIMTLLFMLLILSFLITRQRTYIYENTKLDDKIAFKSTLRARDFAWVMLSNILLIAITLGLATPWAKVRMARLTLENTHVDTSVGFEEYLSQKEQEQSSLGDQIGDAFDVDVGVGL